MSKRISREEFLKRFLERYPKCDIEIIEYIAISKPLIIKCKKCGREIKKTIARQLLQGFDCCGSRPRIKIKDCKNTESSLALEIAQNQLDERFNKIIKILRYNGQCERNRYKCLECGFIFDQRHSRLSGCPKCRKKKK